MYKDLEKEEKLVYLGTDYYRHEVISMAQRWQHVPGMVSVAGALSKGVG